MARISRLPTHAPTGVAIAATSADTMIVIISPLIHALLFNAHFREPCFYVEARARFVGKFIVPVHRRAGILLELLFYQLHKRRLLRRVRVSLLFFFQPGVVRGGQPPT